MPVYVRVTLPLCQVLSIAQSGDTITLPSQSLHYRCINVTLPLHYRYITPASYITPLPRADVDAVPRGRHLQPRQAARLVPRMDRPRAGRVLQPGGPRRRLALAASWPSPPLGTLSSRALLSGELLLSPRRGQTTTTTTTTSSNSKSSSSRARCC